MSRKWPPGIFRRSFIRAYAKAIGVDVEATTREFLQRFPDPDPDGLNRPKPTLPASPLRLTLARRRHVVLSRSDPRVGARPLPGDRVRRGDDRDAGCRDRAGCSRRCGCRCAW